MPEWTWFHHPEMQARIRRAESDLAEGRSTQTQTPEEAQSFLDGLKKASTAKQRALWHLTSRR